MAICYDMRFAELAIAMRGKGATVLVYPGAFNTVTGPLHWERAHRDLFFFFSLLRRRAPFSSRRKKTQKQNQKSAVAGCVGPIPNLGREEEGPQSVRALGCWRARARSTRRRSWWPEPTGAIEDSRWSLRVGVDWFRTRTIESVLESHRTVRNSRSSKSRCLETNPSYE